MTAALNFPAATTARTTTIMDDRAKYVMKFLQENGRRIVADKALKDIGVG